MAKVRQIQIYVHIKADHFAHIPIESSPTKAVGFKLLEYWSRCSKAISFWFNIISHLRLSTWDICFDVWEPHVIDGKEELYLKKWQD